MILRAGTGNSRTRKARNGGGLPAEGYPLIGDGHTAGRPGNSACPAAPGRGGHLGWGDVQRARRLGLSNATFWRHLRDVATEVRHAASVSMTPAGGDNQGGDGGGNWPAGMPAAPRPRSAG